MDFGDGVDFIVANYFEDTRKALSVQEYFNSVDAREWGVSVPLCGLREYGVISNNIGRGGRNF